MHAEVAGLWKRYLTAFAYSGLLGLVLVIVTSMLARAHVSRVVRPLGSLAEEFLDIGTRSDLTRRLQKVRDDEVGVLVEAFNHGNMKSYLLALFRCLNVFLECRAGDIAMMSAIIAPVFIGLAGAAVDFNSLMTHKTNFRTSLMRQHWRRRKRHH
ncbi:HAMP domain-containing protein [Pararhizobium sp. PWRC1-1]|uniref:TadE/TadG family type IV pilus assembly protein n=1 Tax=Pararhizobium sp. PWRC1-1 TaxID=2804566 RepID=UPI003CEA3BC9